VLKLFDRDGEVHASSVSAAGIEILAEFSLVHAGFIPECEFNPVAYSNLVVNHAKVIPNDMGIDAQLASHVPVCETFGYQFDDAMLLRARRSVFVSKGHGYRQGLLIFFITRMPIHNAATIKMSMSARVTRAIVSPDKRSCPTRRFRSKPCTKCGYALYPVHLQKNGSLQVTLRSIALHSPLRKKRYLRLNPRSSLYRPRVQGSQPA
jgi:hypothetical protein